MRKEEIEKHKIAVKKLELIRDRVFKFIKRNLGKVSEYDVQNFIFSEFKKEKLISEKQIQIVGADENTATVHYFPQKANTKIIRKNSLVLIDFWARMNTKRAPFADITWMAYCGKDIPEEVRKIFVRVIKARGFTLSFIRKYLKNKEFPKCKNVEIATRNYFKKFHLDRFLLHKTGHSLGFNSCHGKYFRFDKKCKERIKPNIPFTIEPGLYFKNKFGLRSEINCYITEDYKLIITTKIQKEIAKI